MSSINPLSLFNFWRTKAVLLATPSGTNDLNGNPQAAPVSSDNPLPVMLVGGGGDSGTSVVEKITIVYPPQNLQVGNSQIQLDIPHGSTDATVHVVSGKIRRSIGGDASTNTPLLNEGDSEAISGAELMAYRMIRDSTGALGLQQTGSSDSGYNIWTFTPTPALTPGSSVALIYSPTTMVTLTYNQQANQSEEWTDNGGFYMLVPYGIIPTDLLVDSTYQSTGPDAEISVEYWKVS